MQFVYFSEELVIVILLKACDPLLRYICNFKLYPLVHWLFLIYQVKVTLKLQRSTS